MRRVLYACVLIALAVGAQAISEDARDVFNNVYRTGAWGPDGEGSGPGSTVLFTAHVREFLLRFIRHFQVKRMVDAPCGSFHWMRYVVEKVEDTDFSYTGVDVADGVIARLKDANVSQCTFVRGDLIADPLPPNADLIFSRDALQHS